MVAKVLMIAGSDSGGGAGFQSDRMTFSALGVYGAFVVTAVTAQNTKSVTAIHPIPDDIVVAQIKAVPDDARIDALKLSLVGCATLLMPILPEAAERVGEGSIQSQAQALLQLGLGAVLMKGGHAARRSTPKPYPAGRGPH